MTLDQRSEQVRQEDGGGEAPVGRARYGDRRSAIATDEEIKGVIEGELQDGQDVCGIELVLVQGRVGLTTGDELAFAETIRIV